jgi:uncharacterized protein YjbJ (UPF0337 family)
MMTVDQLDSKWEDIKDQVKQKWSKLTSSDLDAIHEKKEKKSELLGKLKERYGYTAAQADSELGAFMKNCGCSSAADSSKCATSDSPKGSTHESHKGVAHEAHKVSSLDAHRVATPEVQKGAISSD